MDMLALALLLAVANTKVIDYFAEPAKKKYPGVDFWWLIYVALLTGAGIAWFSGVNLFADLIAHALVGRVLSAVLVGGGSSLIHDVFDQS
ncbi:MAG: hypothetical protein KC449_05150 [Anaerolineales bacterium]|nr:hypothetical protein [Anaerolineales bacterium]